jgi:16S rRNA processing protein RimM
VNLGVARVRSQRAGHTGGSEVQGRTPEPRYLAVGQIVGAHGLYGELKVEVLSEDPHRFGVLQRVYVGPEDQEPVRRKIEGYRLHKGRVLLKLEDCDDRSTAETLRGYLVQVPLEEATPLEDGEYYEHQIVGLDVWTVSEELLGQVAEIIYTPANDVYVVGRAGHNGREILIPAIEGVIVEVDLQAGRLVVNLPDGLL